MESLLLIPASAIDAPVEEFDAPPAFNAESMRTVARQRREGRHAEEVEQLIAAVTEKIQESAGKGGLFAVLEGDYDEAVCGSVRDHFEGLGFKVTFVPGECYPSVGGYIRVNF